MDATNIVEVISDFVSLRKRGTSYVGLCPFHDDRTPSFSVSPSRGVYKCFACGKSGNAVGFVMEHEQVTYPEALRYLAAKYHIEIKEHELSDEERQQQNDRESMFIVNEWAATYFHDILKHDVDGQAIGLQYFRQRGFRDDIIERFRLGFALSRRTALSEESKRKGYRWEYLVKAGLLVQRDDGSTYDRFAGRVIFPWVGVSGKVIAFGGRLLDARTKGVAQKYVNSPDSEIYHKDHELYGIYQAKRAISSEDCVYMVEGYTDVISMHQCGIENVVANSGTALSTHQIKLLRRFTENIVLLYDGDEAGIHAALRGTDMLLAEGMNVKVLLLPPDEDPDSFARNHTAEEFRKHIADHQTDFIEFKTRVLLSGVTDPVKRSSAISNIVASVAVITDPVKRATYIQECAQQTGIEERVLIAQMNRFIRQRRDERQRELEREARREEALSVDAPAAPSPTALEPLAPRAEAQPTLAMLEQLIVELVVRHGEKVIFRGVKNEADGETMDVTVAQYVYYDLSADNMTLADSTAQQILYEAVTHSGEPQFVAEHYFCQHADMKVSAMAIRLSTNPVHLSRSLRIKPDEERLRTQAVHMVLDYKMAIVENDLRQLRRRLAEVSADGEQVLAVLGDIKKGEELRNLIAEKIGNRIK